MNKRNITFLGYQGYRQNQYGVTFFRGMTFLLKYQDIYKNT